MAENEKRPRPAVDPDATDDIGYRENGEERAYERAQPDTQPTVSSEPEPDAEPTDAG